MSQIRKRSSKKQNFSANHEGKHKSINGKRPEQAEQVRLETIVGMIRGNTSRKRPREQSEQWLDNEISFPSTPGCQLVDSPVILEALIEGFLVRRIYVDGGSSSEVMYEHCFRNLRAETRAKLKESRTPLVGFSGEHTDAFAWTPADMTGIPRFIAEHELKTYPHIKPMVQRKRSIAPDRRKVVKDEVAEWLKDGIVRRNAGATYQILVDTIFEGQMRRNLEAYVDDMVIKSKTEPGMIKDVKETLLTLKKVNMKLNPKKSSFGMEDGKFLGYIVTSEGITGNPEKAKAVINMPSPNNLKQMQRLSV
ncbi:reverse transcriptase domain-containing protein [Tanacetum coccineum]